jgi:hypothetical protein
VHAVFFRALMARHSATGDAAIPAAVAKHYLSGTAPHSYYREVANVETICWASEQTGDKRLLDHALEAFRGYNECCPQQDTSLKNLLSAKRATEHGVTFLGTFEFAAQGDKPRLYLLEVHGVGVAFGLTASDEPFAIVLSAEDLAREKVLHRELVRELDALVEPRPGVPVVVVGARHRLTVVVGVQASRLTAQVAIDGVELRSGNVVRPPKTVARVLVMPMQPMFVWQAVVEGQP